MGKSKDTLGVQELFPGADLSPEAVEFGKAVERFKHCTGRRFLALSDYLAVLLSLGYTRPRFFRDKLRPEQRQEVLRLVRQGYSGREIARRLSLGKTAVCDILKKAKRP